jgi:hypothetical protein
MRRAASAAAMVLLAGWLAWFEIAPRAAPGGFAEDIRQLSEPEGAFDTDNLISNERSFLEVIPVLASRGVSGGAYIGVGPDQNFSYIARIRPAIAYIIDIRRDNLLLHLLFKALFAQAPSRVAYLSLLTGRAPPAGAAAPWSTAPLDRLVRHADQAPRLDGAAARALRADLTRTIRAFGVPLSAADLATIERFHGSFIERGLDLQFNSHGRPPRPQYPTLRELILATDRDGRAWHYLAAERDYQFVRQLQAADLVIPVVGDVSGPHALAAIGRAIAARKGQVSAFYVSNVESYLNRGGAYERYMANLNLLPRGPRSVMIRSIFGGAAGSASAVQPMGEMVAASAYR